RGRVVSRTATPTSSTGRPRRAAYRSPRSCRRRATAAPTVPAPSRARRTGWLTGCSGSVGYDGRRAGRPRSHPLGGGDAQETQAVGEDLPGGVVEPQPRAVQVRDLLVLGHGAHAALVVPLVEPSGQILQVARDAVRLAQLGSLGDHPG